MQHKMNASLSVHLVYACICMLVGYCWDFTILWTLYFRCIL